MSSTVLRDHSGNDRDGVYFGECVSVEGAVVGDRARQFGIGTFAVVPYSPAIAPPAPWTYEVWARPIVASTWATPLSVRWAVSGTGGPSRGMNFYRAHPTQAGGPDYASSSPSAWELWIGRDSTSFQVITTGTPAPLDQWAYLVGTMDAGKTARFYVDGAFVGSLAAPDHNPVTPGDGIDLTLALISQGAPEGTLPLRGPIDELVVHHRALSAGEIAARYALRGDAAAYRESVLSDSPAAYYRLSETCGGWLVGAVGIG